MSHQQPPLQVGGAAVLGASAAKQLAFTGVQAVKGLFMLMVSLAGTGTALVRRGRKMAIDAGHPLEDDQR